jgi:hypothetical protein
VEPADFSPVMDSFRQSCYRIALAISIAVPVWLALTGLFLMMPPILAIGGMLLGVVLFKCGAELKRKWIAAAGGVLMFAAVFAWAINR